MTLGADRARRHPVLTAPRLSRYDPSDIYFRKISRSFTCEDCFEATSGILVDDQGADAGKL